MMEAAFQKEHWQDVHPDLRELLVLMTAEEKSARPNAAQCLALARSMAFWEKWKRASGLNHDDWRNQWEARIYQTVTRDNKILYYFVQTAFTTHDNQLLTSIEEGSASYRSWMDSFQLLILRGIIGWEILLRDIVTYCARYIVSPV